MSKSRNHSIERHHFSANASCSATRCTNEPIYICGFQKQNGTWVERHYCSQHGFQFVQKNNLSLPPKEPEDVRAMDLSKFTPSALKELRRLIDLHLEKETKAKTDSAEDNGRMSFRFLGYAKAGEKKPYVARLYYENDRLERFFFKLDSEPEEDGSTLYTGQYSVFPGAVIEKRVNGDEGWQRFCVSSAGEEVYVCSFQNREQCDKRVVAYLKKEMSFAGLLVTK